VVTPCVITAADQPPDVPILGTGFTPNSPLTVKTDGYQANVDAPRADAAGAVTYQLRTPVGEFGADHPIKLEVVDAAGVSAATTFLMVYRSPAFPERTKTGARVTVSAYGFPVGRPVYVFYEYRGIVRTAVRLGIAAAPCGRVSRRIRILPPRRRRRVARRSGKLSKSRQVRVRPPPAQGRHERAQPGRGMTATANPQHRGRVAARRQPREGGPT
jgi:hypothetical protein